MNQDYAGRFASIGSENNIPKEFLIDRPFYDAVLFQINKGRAIKLDGKSRDIPKELTKRKTISVAFPYRPKKDFPDYYSPKGFEVFIKNTWFPISYLVKEIKTDDLRKWGGKAEEMAGAIETLPNDAKFAVIRNDNFVFIYRWNIFSKTGVLDKVLRRDKFTELRPKPYEFGNTGVFLLETFEQLEQKDKDEENPFKEAERQKNTMTKETTTPETNAPVTAPPLITGIKNTYLYIGIAAVIILLVIYFLRK
jgi:hypothetical protein